MSATIISHDLLQERSEEVPRHFSLVPQTSTGESAEAVAQYLAQVSKFPLFQLRVHGHTFTPLKPIVVQITQDGEWFFAENSNLRVTGSGRSYEEAVLDFEMHIVHFWEYYKNLSADQVIGDAINLKAVFTNLLIAQ